MPGYETIIMEVEIDPGVTVARHTHPGVESSYVLEGGFELPIQGQPTRTLKPGDGFQIPAETPHAGGKPGDKISRLAITYVVEKGKPLARLRRDQTEYPRTSLRRNSETLHRAEVTPTARPSRCCRGWMASITSRRCIVAPAITSRLPWPLIS
jgi:mannose-6-phosphate isomerase-like protein (cupin superfamily)